MPADDPIPADEAAERFASVVTALRLWAPGRRDRSARPAGAQSDEARWQPLPIGGGARARGGDWLLPGGEEQAFREFFTAIARADAPAARGVGARPLRDGLRARRPTPRRCPTTCSRLRALLDATSDAGEASLALRLAALCAEEGSRGELQRRIEAALALERFVMGGASSDAGIDGGVRRASSSRRSRATCARCCATSSAATWTAT